MTGRAIVSLGGLAWSLGVIALILKSPMVSRPNGPDPHASIAEDSLALPVSILNQADGFYGATVGEAAITPNEVLAWRAISRSPNAQAAFARLFETATVPGKLYALAGLWWVNQDRDQFEHAEQALLARGGTLRTRRGCIVAEESVAGIIHDIDRGQWSREFLMGRSDDWDPGRAQP